MAKFTFNLPDIGEGIAEAEIVAVQMHQACLARAKPHQAAVGIGDVAGVAAPEDRFGLFEGLGTGCQRLVPRRKVADAEVQCSVSLRIE